MEIARLNQEQRLALLDLLVLAMYSDGHLDLVEDARLERLLTTMGFGTEYDRGRQLDESVTRLREYSQTPELARKHAAELAKNFSGAEQCRGVYQLVEQQINSDNKVDADEHEFLSAVRAALQL